MWSGEPDLARRAAVVVVGVVVPEPVEPALAPISICASGRPSATEAKAGSSAEQRAVSLVWVWRVASVSSSRSRRASQKRSAPRRSPSSGRRVPPAVG